MYEQEKDNCILALRNIPKGSEVGIDYHSWYTGERFKGISNVPAGFHFVFIRVADKYGEMAPRSGFFIFMHPGETICKSFEQENEEFETLEEIISFEEMKDTLTQMAPYPNAECKLWPQLTCNVASSVFERLQPVSKRVCSYTEVAFDKDESPTGRMRRMLIKSDSRTVQLNDTGDENYIKFTKIPTVKSNSPSELSRNALDTSVCLEQLIRDIPEGSKGLLGEMQFAFITFLIGQVYDAFEHWKQLLSLICGCMESVSKLSLFYEDFIGVIGLQLDELPVDFFLDINPQKNVVYLLFQEFFQNINETHGIGLSANLFTKISMLKEKLFRRYQWEFDEVLEDEMPTIVEMT